VRSNVEDRAYARGTIEVVDIRPHRAGLDGDHAAGSTTLALAVNEAVFTSTGGQVRINGTVYAYTAYDDTADTMTLSSGLTADAEDDDWVNVYDQLYATIRTTKAAEVSLLGTADNDTPIKAEFSQQLLDKLVGGIRGTIGEACLLELDGSTWRIVDIHGLDDPDTGPGENFKIDPFVVAAPGAQSLPLTYEPLPESHHLYWNGDEQEGAYTIVGQTAEIDSTEGADLEVGDDLVVKYAYRKGPSTEVEFTPLDIPGMLIWYSSDYPTHDVAVNVDGWPDLSGNNYDAVSHYYNGSLPEWRPGVTPGGPLGDGSMNFRNGGYFDLPPAAFSGVTEAECFFIVKGEVEQSYASFHQLTGSGDLQHYNDGAYGWAEQWGSTTRRGLGVISVAPWARINMWSRPPGTGHPSGEWGCKVDGTTKLIDTSSNGVGFGASGDLYQIGLGYVVAGTFPGYVAAYLMWDRVLTDDERAAVDAYLAANPSGGRP
jgi:hypothetical protein